MKINLAFLRRLVSFEEQGAAFKELLASLDIEVAAMTRFGDSEVAEIEITPNRPDWLSHYGVAREIAAKKGRCSNPWPPIISICPRIPIRFRGGNRIRRDCSRFFGCLVENVAVRESCPKVRALVESLGLRPINNLVDISNLVMYICGQPFHFYDVAQLAGRRIVVRRARNGERLTLLDEKQLALDGSHLVIADGEKPVGLAGIMGGLGSGINDATRQVFIECAHFNPVLIKKAVRLMGLRTDASYRFERGCDPAAYRLRSGSP